VKYFIRDCHTDEGDPVDNTSTSKKDDSMVEEKSPPKASARNVKWLTRELPGWVAEGLIGQDAADRIAERYKLAQAAGGRAKLVLVLGILAALLLGAGVIMFFASNWDKIPRFNKLLIICTALWGSYLSGYYLRFRRDYNIMGDALVLLGTLLFGAGIYLVAQAFNINAHFPNGALLWMLGLVPLAVLMKSKPVLAEITILFCVWLILEIESIGYGASRGAYQSLEFRCLAGLALFAGLAVLVYRFGHKINAALLVPALVVWLTILSIARMEIQEVEYGGQLILVYFLFFVALGAVGVFHRRIEALRPFSGVYQAYSVMIIAAMLYALTFPELTRELIVKNVILYPILLGFFFISVIVAAAVFLWRGAGEESARLDRAELGVYLAMALLGYVLFFLMARDMEKWAIAKEVGVVANLILFGFIIAMIAMGYLGGYPRFINLGLFLFVVDLITRYFDWFWKLMPKSLFFMAGGTILLVGGILLEKQRKKWVLRAKEAAG